jgi:glycerol-3-phosphate cytidylyltransferase
MSMMLNTAFGAMNGKVGFTCSCFDLFHAGHVLMLEEAKQHCDYLIVGLQTDPTLDRPEKNKPVQSVYERYVQLKGCKYVDEIIPYSTEEDLLNLLTTVNYDVRILGEEYSEKDYTGRFLAKETYYNKRLHTYSSTELRKRIESSNNN